jgi:hypothetical protein
MCDAESDWLPTVGNAHTCQSSYMCAAAGSSSNPILLDMPPPKAPATKRQKKTKDTDESAPEKRGAVLKKKCPKNIEERLERVMTQRRVVSRYVNAVSLITSFADSLWLTGIEMVRSFARNLKYWARRVMYV